MHRSIMSLANLRGIVVWQLTRIVDSALPSMVESMSVVGFNGYLILFGLY